MKTEVQAKRTSEPVTFVADARLISILGEQLIGSERVGVLELVKNAYDAGASLCSVKIAKVPGLSRVTQLDLDDSELEGPVLEIRDDGSGMNHEQLVSGWLRPATTSRSRVKEKLRTGRAEVDQGGSPAAYAALTDSLRAAHGGRIPLGEKGIGRLATHRLGRKLWLRTKTQDDPREWELQIDWSEFDRIGETPRDLSSIQLELRHQEPSIDYGPKNQGTSITCYGGRPGFEWTIDSLIELGRTLEDLQSPRAPSGFSVSFQTSHVRPESYSRPSLASAPFEIVAVVSEIGEAEIQLNFQGPRHLEHSPPDQAKSYSVDLRSKNKPYWKASLQRSIGPDGSKSSDELREPSCGQFLLAAKCWIRLPKWLGSDFKETTKYLNRWGGLSIYRDGVLSQPAQQVVQSDWLGLAAQQIKKSSRLSYYQLEGQIEIEQPKTLTLRDKSSREGLLETRPFADLTELTKAILLELENFTRTIRDEWSRAKKVRALSIRSAVGANKKAARFLLGFAKSYDFTRDSLDLRSSVSSFQSAEQARGLADELERAGELLSLREDERNGLLEAAGFGLAIAISLHEVASLSAAIASDCQDILKASSVAGARGRIEQVAKRASALSTEVARLAPLRTARSERTRMISVRRAAVAGRNALALASKSSRVDIEVSADDFAVEARFGALAQVFANLFDNSLYWLEGSAAPRIVKVVLDASRRTVLVADSGPGVSDRMVDVLFEPFYSEKSVPSGLGLYICRYYLSQMGASIRLAAADERNDLSGAQFLLEFVKESETTK